MTLENDLYASMLRLRIVEETIAALYSEQEMKCPTHLYTGQEAVAVGVCAHLRDDDAVCFSHRSHGWYLAKGGDLRKMMAEIYGKATGCSGGWGGSMHLVDVAKGVMGGSAIVGGTTPHAVGCALAFKMQKTDRVAITAFGDAAPEAGVFHESLNFASLKKLPVIFVCENNLYSTQTPLNVRQPDIEIYTRAANYDMRGVMVDGNDVLAVHEAAREAVARARHGEGPTLLECRTYRWREHVGPLYDYDLGYRTKEELDQWMARCPIKKMESSGAVSAVLAEELHDRFTREMEDAVKFAKESPVLELQPT